MDRSSRASMSEADCFGSAEWRGDTAQARSLVSISRLADSKASGRNREIDVFLWPSPASTHSSRGWDLPPFTETSLCSSTSLEPAPLAEY